MMTRQKMLQIEALNNRLGMLFEKLNNGEWIDEIRLSTKEAAAVLGISPNALRIKVHRGQIEAEKLGNELRFRLSSLCSAFIKLEV
ncbi:MAG: hypothetical protein CME69_11430 [Halobacteriovorax sp.]|nr:hypothetical protein [Halobacteriovorax sp.]